MMMEETWQMQIGDSEKMKHSTQSKSIFTGSFDSPRLLRAFLLTFCFMQFSAFGSDAQSYSGTTVPVPHPLTILLRSKAVHKELQLSHEQINEIEDAVNLVDLPLWRLRDMPSDKRSETATPLIEHLSNKLSGILSDRQLERLNQITLQALDVDAFLSPQVVAKLKISPGQYSNISSLLASSYKQLASLQNDAAISSDSIRAARILQLQAESRQNLLKVLNQDQRQAFSMLLGRPFDLSRVKRIVCRAPQFKVETWLNSQPLTMAELKGKVTVVHFYAFGCGNCVRTLPYYNDWHKLFAADDFNIIGIHRPETKQEHILEKVKSKAAEAGMDYPIAIDNDSIAWDAWANHIWPSIYLVDRDGFVRYWWYGELNYQGAQTEPYLRARIQELIDEEPMSETANAAGG